MGFSENSLKNGFLSAVIHPHSATRRQKTYIPLSASQVNFGFQKRACDEGCVRRGVRGEVLQAQPVLHLRHIPHNLPVPRSALRGFERWSKDVRLHPCEFLCECCALL